MRLACHETSYYTIHFHDTKRLQHRRKTLVKARRYHQQKTAAAGGVATLSATAKDDYEDRLLELLSLDSEDLKGLAVKSSGAIDMGFLLWLASREDAASGAEKQRLGTLASQLTALHEGLEPAAMESLERASTALVEMDVPRENALVQLDARWRALTKDPAAAALSLEAAQLAERQVSQLGAGVRDSKTTSALELIGRKRLGEGESLPLGPADPASRILEALLAVEDERERLELLPSAFEPPAEGELPPEDPEADEQLHTTPASLLQAINFALSRLEQGSPAAASLVGSVENASGAGDFKSRLLSLRAEVFRIWDGGMPDA